MISRALKSRYTFQRILAVAVARGVMVSLARPYRLGPVELAAGHAQLGKDGHHHQNYAQTSDELLEGAPEEQAVKCLAIHGLEGDIVARQVAGHPVHKSGADTIIDQSGIDNVVPLGV